MKHDNTLSTVAFAFGVVSIVGVALLAAVYIILAVVMFSTGTDEGSVLGSGYITSGIICVIPLAWAIPMTLKMNRVRKGEETAGIAFCICTLLFLNLISGILLLVDQSKNY